MFYQNPKLNFRILDVFYVERGKRDVFETGRTHTAISYRVKGSSIFYSKNESMEANTGSVTYIPPGIDYRHKNDSAERIVILRLESLGEIEECLQVENGNEELEPLFLKLLKIWEENDSTSYNRCLSLLYRIFEGLQLKNERDLPTVPPSISAGVERMRKEFRDPSLTVASLAASCFVSEVYFRRVYRAHFGVSPLQTILELRFQYACRLLRSGYYSQKQVAFLSGFSDVKYFRTAFKKRHGKTPLEFAENE